MQATREQIFEKLRAILAESFELEPARITPAAKLFDDLELDSIDAVDLAIKLQEFVGRRVKGEEFRNVRTVDDVVELVRLMQAAA